MECKKCGKDNGWNFSDCLCIDCKNKSRKIIFAIAIPLAFIAMLIGGLVGNIQYSYDVDKCREMNTSDIAYEFTHDVQLNVKYSEKCYYMNNHPMAQFWAIFGAALVGVMVIFFITMMTAMIIYV